MRLSVRGFYLAAALALAVTPAAAQFNGLSGIFALNHMTFAVILPRRRLSLRHQRHGHSLHHLIRRDHRDHPDHSWPLHRPSLLRFPWRYQWPMLLHPSGHLWFGCGCHHLRLFRLCRSHFG